MQQPKSRLLISMRAMKQVQLSTDEAKGAIDRNFDIGFPEDLEKPSKSQMDEYKRITDSLKQVRETEIDESKETRDEQIETQQNYLKGRTRRNPRDSFAIDGLEYQNQLLSGKNTFKARHDERKKLIEAGIPDESIDQIAKGLMQGYDVIDMVPDNVPFVGNQDMVQKIQQKVLDMGYEQRIVTGSTGLLELMQSRRMIDQNQRENAFDSIDQGLNNNVEQPDLTPGEHLTHIQIARKKVDGQHMDEQRQDHGWGAKVKPQQNVKNDDLILELDENNMPVEKKQFKIGNRTRSKQDKNSPGGLDNNI